MPRRSKKSTEDKMTIRQQATALLAVAKISFTSAPGAVLFKLCGAIVTAVLPFVTAYYAALTTTALAEAYGGDAAAGSRAITYVIITAGLGLFMTVWRTIDQYIQTKMRYIIEAKVSDHMYKKFLELSFAQYDDKATADLYDKAQRFTSFFAYIFDNLASIIAECITMIAGIVALISVNAWLALAILAAIIPGVVIQFKLSRAQIAHWNKNIDTRRTQHRIEWELLQPNVISELRVYGMIRHLMNLRALMREKDERYRIEFERKYIAKRLLSDAIEAIAEVGSLLWTVVQIIHHAMPLGQFVFVQQVVSRAMSSASSFVSQLSSIDEDIANLFDYEKFIRLPTATGGTIPVSDDPASIRFEDVSFAYQSRKDEMVLRDITLEITKGQHVAIVGENGAGKSTLIKLLTGLYAPTSGAIYIDGENMQNIDIASWHQKLGVLQQSSLQYAFATARDNVWFGNVSTKPSDEAINEALRQAEAYEFILDLPRGLDNYVNVWMEDDKGNKGVDLSGGQWQRLALARNFYRDAPIVILDEPTSAIDALAESRIFKRLFREKDKTIVTISHRLTTIEKADVIYMLEDGRIVEQGTHDELIQKRGRYYRMFESQLRIDEKENT